MKNLFVTIIGIFFFSNIAFSMGGDKPGPNGGYITMPGTYHVELVDKGNTMQVYLLDLDMKNPIVKDSSVSLNFISNLTKKVNCRPKNKFFVCDKPSKDLAMYKEINLESVRNKVKGQVAIYKLPLQFEK